MSKKVEDIKQKVNQKHIEFYDKTLSVAGGISSDLNTTSYVPEKNFNTCYKGYGLYGVGAPRADYLGTVKVKAELALG